MLSLNTQIRTNVGYAAEQASFFVAPDQNRVVELKGSDMTETLAFLNLRPVHTVVMTSFIMDNGIESDLNRGRFYGYRNSAGELEGVALIGHTTLVEARSVQALRALAVAARNPETPIHLVMSSGRAAEDFWQHMTNGLQKPRLVCTEELFETAFPFMVPRSTRRVENATIDDLMQVAEAQAEVAFIESGVDPLLRDREGFLNRVARRIEQERVFVVRENGKIVFKADIIAETGSVVYLEGVYTAPQYRGRGVASECLSVLVLELLNRAENVCLLSNIDFTAAHKCFEKAGLRNTDKCTTVFV